MFFLDEASNGGTRAGDWTCSGCNQSNSARNSICFKCDAEKPDVGDTGTSYGDDRPISDNDNGM